ncbi:hypothetical protein ACQEVF_32705 [Nonomuraea polychroma]|uniref:hypothetical protein n=1 Tax=Nonomuraea polychroma TaxID=46176 RepID=UPI003D94CCA5
MSTPHPEETPAALARVRGRIQRINSLLAWQERTLRREQQLEAENARLRAELAANQHIIQSLMFAVDLDPAQAPPPQLVVAWHTGSLDCIPVIIEIDGMEWLFIVDGKPRIPNPVQEYHDWQRIKAIHRERAAEMAKLNDLEEQ